MAWFNFNKAEDNLPKLETPLEKAWNKLSEDEQKLSKSIIKAIEIATKMGLKSKDFFQDTYYCGEVKVERYYSCGSMYKYGKRYDKNLNNCSYSVNDYLAKYFRQEELERLNKKSEEFVQYMEKVNLYTVKFND